MLESWLTDYLHSVTRRLRAALPAAERQALEARDALEQQDLAAAGRGQLAGEQQALPARTTGDAAWLAARGEDGSSVQRPEGAGAAAAVPPPGTRYRLAKDEGLAAAQPRRLCGGAVRASGENAPSEVATAAADGNPHSKWVSVWLGGRGAGGVCFNCLPELPGLPCQLWLMGPAVPADNPVRPCLPNSWTLAASRATCGWSTACLQSSHGLCWTATR